VLRRLQHPHILAYIESFADAKYATPGVEPNC